LFTHRKRYGAHPDLSGDIQFKRDKRLHPKVYYPGAMEERRKKEDLFYVFREPVSRECPHDVIGAMFSEKRAINMADRYAKNYGRRAVVGLLLADVGWH